jgi:hypothetical protein
LFIVPSSELVFVRGGRVVAGNVPHRRAPINVFRVDTK